MLELVRVWLLSLWHVTPQGVWTHIRLYWSTQEQQQQVPPLPLLRVILIPEQYQQEHCHHCLAYGRQRCQCELSPCSTFLPNSTATAATVRVFVELGTGENWRPCD